MDAMLPLWIIGSVLVLAIIDRLSIKKGSTTYADRAHGYPPVGAPLARV